MKTRFPHCPSQASGQMGGGGDSNKRGYYTSAFWVVCYIHEICLENFRSNPSRSIFFLNFISWTLVWAFQIPWNWSYRHLWATVWVLGNKPRSSVKAARTLCHWTNSSAPSRFFFSLISSRGVSNRTMEQCLLAQMPSLAFSGSESLLQFLKFSTAGPLESHLDAENLAIPRNQRI